mmetsp:Transcript_29326/g.58198  ORF Transcript_29326/g.58198 Transcript_29326/m.58198 type:complete len:343 (-) Transcript_29326:233-1261(-)
MHPAPHDSSILHALSPPLAHHICQRDCHISQCPPVPTAVHRLQQPPRLLSPLVLPQLLQPHELLQLPPAPLPDRPVGTPLPVGPLPVQRRGDALQRPARVRPRRQHQRVALAQRSRGGDPREPPRRRGGVGVHPERRRAVRSAEFAVHAPAHLPGRRHLHHQGGAVRGVDVPHADLRGGAPPHQHLLAEEPPRERVGAPQQRPEARVREDLLVVLQRLEEDGPLLRDAACGPIGDVGEVPVAQEAADGHEGVGAGVVVVVRVVGPGGETAAAVVAVVGVVRVRVPAAAEGHDGERWVGLRVGPAEQSLRPGTGAHFCPLGRGRVPAAVCDLSLCCAPLHFLQ